MNFIGAEIYHNIRLLRPFKQLQKTIGLQLGKYDFFNQYADESIRQWINFLDRWRPFSGMVDADYWDDLEARYRGYESFDYWRLVFMIENVDPGFIEKAIPQDSTEMFAALLSKRVVELREGLNFVGGRPKTEERWVPLFKAVDDLVTTMKTSSEGERIRRELLADWQEVKKHSDFCKNRHRGMMKSGYWRPYNQLTEFTSLREPLIPSINGVPLCPRCGARMAVRTARRGSKAGQQFYGCSNYPKCKQTLSTGRFKR
jgi:ssDNA-binding Zn-finger/Zn-ribbon topoisomerase 1